MLKFDKREQKKLRNKIKIAHHEKEWKSCIMTLRPLGRSSSHINGLLEVAYGGGEAASFLSIAGSFVSFCEAIFLHGCGLTIRNFFERYSGVDLTEENAEKVRERADYIRKKLEEK